MRKEGQSIRDAIGDKLSALGKDGAKYVLEHQKLFWCIGMVLTAIADFLFAGCDLNKFKSAIAIASLAIYIPCLGGCFAFLSWAFCGLLSKSDYVIRNPLKALFKAVLFIIAVGFLFLTITIEYGNN